MRSDEQIDLIAQDCVHFKGDRPCQPHMKRGVSCRCSAYRPQSNRTLIVQLSDPARVIRCNALVQRIKSDEPDCHVTFLTDYPELLGEDVNQPLANDGSAVFYVQTRPFDRVINLDLDPRAGAIVNAINAPCKKGYYLRNGHVRPVDSDARRPYLSHLFPFGWSMDQMTEVRELFQTCGLAYRREVPSLTRREASVDDRADHPVTVALCPEFGNKPGFNVAWDAEKWWSLGGMLHDFHLRTIMIGPAEDRPAELQEIPCSRGLDWGSMLAILRKTDVVITSVPGVAEAALALRKRAVLLAANRAARYDLALYHGRGLIAAPEDEQAGAADLAGLAVKEVFQVALNHVNDLPGYEGPTRCWTVLASVCDNIQAVRQQVAGTRESSTPG